MIPAAYSLKRHVRQTNGIFWHGDKLVGLNVAPAYVFPDREAFDSEEVRELVLAIGHSAPMLPHPAVTFEVQDVAGPFRTQLVYAWQTGASAEAVFFLQNAESRRWSDVLAYGRLDPGDRGSFEANPRFGPEDRRKLELAIPILLWRALAILSEAGTVTERTVSRIHRPKLARDGVRGWTWHQVEIVPERLVRRAAPQGGSHASPRWHIRRGHWRQLADGRRVFVRECEVGDATRGGVLKDYIVGEGQAA